MIEVWKKLSEHYGFSLIPLHGKAPFEIGWQRWCVEKRNFSQFVFKGCNAGVACGPASKVIVLDIDKEERFKELRAEHNWEIPKTFTVKTGAAKFHFYYSYVENGKEYGCSSWKENDETVFDIKGKGGQVVAPGSIHPDTGMPYEIVRDIPMAPTPKWMLDRCAAEEIVREPYIHIPGDFRWDGDIDSLPISEEMKTLIVNGENIGSRSEAIMSVVNSLVWANLSDSEIIGIFDRNPIGDKYREKKRAKSKWLNKHIDKARSYVTDRADMHREQRAPLAAVSNVSNVSEESTVSAVGICKQEEAECKHGVSSGKQDSAENPLSSLVKDWILESPGQFHVSEIDKEFNLRTRVEKNHRAKILHDLCFKSKILEQIRGRKGSYQVIDQECAEIDFLGCSSTKHPIILPFQIEELAKIMPGNIIVIAGEPDAGKTAFLLNVLLLNLIYKEKEKESNKEKEKETTLKHTVKINYLSSEMGSQEFRERFEKMGDIPMVHWASVVREGRLKIRERFDNFHQVLWPDDVNIIDFLEVHEDFWKVGAYLRTIHEKLNKGIAIVALQKNPGTDYGLGGMRGMEKPRLYLSLSRNPPDGNTIKIVKCKNAIGGNQSGKERDFKLVAGWKIMTQTEWRYPNAKRSENGKENYGANRTW